ncbi:MAG: toll/interleukin-1 receptor domain-containing protein [Oscillospiraceae bacterium]|nr:toll/interleukin-1 receptor domain-containing protein [Oscillospiraceae bacterium]
MDREYIAFISYRHLPLDKEVATRLHRLIERYVIPKDLRKDGKKQLGLVFRDQDELPLSNNLTQDIYNALDHAQFLIVVCTPDTPKSMWVQREIQYFVEKHGHNRVLTVLAAGTAEESIPEAVTTIYAQDRTTVLNRVEPLCAYLVDKSQRRVLQNLRGEFLRIVAALLNCPYDAIRQRHKRYRRRLWTVLGTAVMAVVLTILALLVGWNLDVSAMNQQLQEQLTITQKSESETLGILSLQKWQQGDRMGAVATALQGLPSEEMDRAYSDKSVYALSQALYLYRDYGYGFHSQISHGQQIRHAAASSGGKYAFLYDTAGQGSLYDLQSSRKLWSAQVHDTYYDYFLEGLCIQETQNRITFNSAGQYYELALDTGEIIYTSGADGASQNRYDGLLNDLHSTVRADPELPVTAVHSRTFERENWWETVEHRHFITFFDHEGRKLSQSGMLPVPLSFDYMNDCAFSADNKYFACSFAGGGNLYLFVLDTETASIQNAFSISYSQLPGVPNEGDYNHRDCGMLMLADKWLYYASGDCLLSLDLKENSPGTALSLPSKALAAHHDQGIISVVLENGTVVQYHTDAYGELLPETQQIGNCGFPLTMACFCGKGGKQLLVIPENSPGNGIVLKLLSDQTTNSVSITPYAPEDPNSSRILPVPGGQGFVEYACYYDENEGNWHGHIRLYQGAALAKEYSVTSESGIDMQGFCAEGSCLLLGHNCFDLETGILTPLDTADYNPDPVYGWDFDYAPIVTEDTDHPAVAASFYTETDCLTWWEDGSQMHSRTSPVDIVDSYYWMNPKDMLEIGNNGLILLRNYQGNAFLDVMLQDDTMDRSRPTEYVVYSIPEDTWISFPNACEVEGIPEVGIAKDKPWVAIADYDGYIRIYDCNAGQCIYQIRWDIPASAVSQIHFLMEDTVLALRHMDENVTIIRIEDGQILGEYTLTGADYDPVCCWQVPHEKRLYLSDAAGSITGLCISTESWEVTAEIPGLLFPVTESGQLLRWNGHTDSLLLSPALSVAELVEQGELLLSAVDRSPQQ